MSAPDRSLFGITHGQPASPEPIRVGGGIRSARSTYDAADDNPGNQRHWANADSLSAKAANSRLVRRKLRDRARLEFDNGGNCKGAVETIGHDLVGTGPRLQLQLPDYAPAGATGLVERLFREWCDDPAVHWADKLRLMAESEVRDGESFALAITNPAVAGKVKLDFRVVETDQVATPLIDPLDPNAVDGIEFDTSGNPTAYHVLKQHPGDLFILFIEATKVPASEVIHWFRPSRAGHCRGIPRITPGLPLLAQLRGFSSATLAAARLAATYAGFVETTLPPDNMADATVAKFDDVEVADGQVMTLPAGWKFNQARPEHPTATHKEFKEAGLTEFGRAIHMPKNVVTGDSSQMNFSSSRLDRLMYQGALRIDRNRMAVTVLDRIFKWWLAEALAVRGFIPDALRAALPPVETWTWVWQFDGFPSINPVDDAAADETNLKNGLVTHGELLAERGVPWRDHFKSLAEQRDLAKALCIEDLLYPWLIKPTPTAVPPPGLNRTNEGTKGKPQAEIDTWIDEEEASYA